MSAAPSLFFFFFTSCAPGYTGSPIPSTTAASFVLISIPPKGVAIFTLSLSPCLFDSIRQPLTNIIPTIAAAAKLRLVCIPASAFPENNTPIQGLKFPQRPCDRRSPSSPKNKSYSPVPQFTSQKHG